MPDGSIKLGNTGIGSLINDNDYTLMSMSHKCYCPPESLDANIKFVDIKYDIWSLGILLLHLSMLELPFLQRELFSLTERVITVKLQEVGSNCSNEFKLLAASFLKISKFERQDIPSILENPYFTNFESESMNIS